MNTWFWVSSLPCSLVEHLLGIWQAKTLHVVGQR